MADRQLSDGFRSINSNSPAISSEAAGFKSKLRKAITASVGAIMVLTGVAQGLNYSNQYHGSLSHVHTVEQAINVIGHQDLHRTSHGMKMDITDVGNFSTEGLDKDFKDSDSKVVYNRHNPEEFMLITRSGDSLNVHISQQVLESKDSYDKTCSFVEEAARYGVENNLNVKVPQAVAESTGIRYVIHDGKAYPMTPEQLSHVGTTIDSYSLKEAKEQGMTVTLPDNDSLHDDIRFTARPDDNGPKEYKQDLPDLQGREPFMQSVIEATAIGTIHNAFNHS